MSKTAQRKRDAYAKGYKVGRYGVWESQSYAFRASVADAFERGRADGKRDRAEIASYARSRGWLLERLIAWLRRRFA